MRFASPLLSLACLGVVSADNIAASFGSKDEFFFGLATAPAQVSETATLCWTFF